MARIYYVGDWAVLTGPWFAESPFQKHHASQKLLCQGYCAKSQLLDVSTNPSSSLTL